MPPGRYRGVTYFCPAAGCWVILDPVGRLSPKASSHLAEADTLALFDDARCRCGRSARLVEQLMCTCWAVGATRHLSGTVLAGKYYL
jgi:hypothetical protein